MINIKLRMSIEQIIFNLLNKNAHTWVRYWQQKEMSGLTMYRAQNEAYMCRSAKNAVIGLCFSVLSAT